MDLFIGFMLKTRNSQVITYLPNEPILRLLNVLSSSFIFIPEHFSHVRVNGRGKGEMEDEMITRREMRDDHEKKVSQRLARRRRRTDNGKEENNRRWQGEEEKDNHQEKEERNYEICTNYISFVHTVHQQQSLRFGRDDERNMIAVTPVHATMHTVELDIWALGENSIQSRNNTM